VRQFHGAWQQLDRDQWTALGKTGRNQALGGGAVLGTRVWDQNASIILAIGPLSLKRFEEFLPGRTAHAALSTIARFYLGTEQTPEAHLILDGQEVPVAIIGRSRLGYTSWLRATKFAGSDQPVRVTLNT